MKEKTIEKIIRLRTDGHGMSANKIAKIVGYSTAWVIRILKREGFDTSIRMTSTLIDDEVRRVFYEELEKKRKGETYLKLGQQARLFKFTPETHRARVRKFAKPEERAFYRRSKNVEEKKETGKFADIHLSDGRVLKWGPRDKNGYRGIAF